VSEILIRPYEPRDHDSLVRLWADVFDGDPPRNAPEVMIRNKARVQPELLFVAVSGSEVVGAVMAGDDGTRGWIHHLAVSPAYRRGGLGTGLMETAERGLKAMGCPKVNLQVRARNSTVVEFYRSIGYQVEDLVSLGKMLNGPDDQDGDVE
jgi:ribosomal protein S18 acetylase RimI-like enzyme